MASTLSDDLAGYVGQVAEPPRVSRYDVDRAMIRNWVEALDDHNPVYVDPAAAAATGRADVICPPAMISTWVMSGYRRYRDVQRMRATGEVEQSAYSQLMKRLDDEGYTSVVATDVQQRYLREVVPGMHVTCHFTIDSVVGPKKTGLGEGFFITLGKRYVDADGSELAQEAFRLLRFRPGGSAS